MIILASASPRRAALLKSLALTFRVEPSSAAELHDATLPLSELCQRNAELKAREVAARFPEDMVLGADTLVGLRGELFGKPRDLAEARTMLLRLSGQTHEVVTGVCLARGDRAHCFFDRTEVTFRNLTDAAVEEYLRSVPVLDKAGAYGIQERGELLVERIDGSFNNVMGLPTERLIVELEPFKAA